jgi:transcriptional regulator with XRE-family HTH domain
MLSILRNWIMNEHEFGARIKARREELGISQKDVAFALDIDQGKVSLLEKGLRRVDVVKELPALAKLLRVPISWFYGDDAIPENQDPMRMLIKQLFPDVEFEEFEIRRMGQFLEPVLQTYVKTDPEMSKKVAG